MKAPQFAYCRPSTLEEAFAILEERGDGAIPLAGGQSLMAVLNMRLGQPEILVDLGGLAELRGLTLEGDVVRIGAMTRHCEVMESPLIRAHLPLIAEAIGQVGHVAIRNRGTFGGSLAHADPAAELPGCVVALDGIVVVAGRGGRREVAAADFFQGMLSTALEPGELILEVRIPAQKPDQVSAFYELSRRHGDFAIAGVAAVATLAGDSVSRARLVYIGCADRPALARTVAEALAGRRLPLRDGDWLAQALDADIAFEDGPGMTAATKARMARAVTLRAINSLQDRAAS